VVASAVAIDKAELLLGRAGTTRDTAAAQERAGRRDPMLDFNVEEREMLRLAIRRELTLRGEPIED
jgi:hypothetical protein